MRNPLTGFPSAGQPTGLSGLPFLILLDHQGFRPLGRATKGAAFGICQPFEKGWTENFVCADRQVLRILRAANNRRRAACRAANET